MSPARPWHVDDTLLADMPDIFADAPSGRPGKAQERGVLGARLAEIDLARITADSPVQTRGFDPDFSAEDASLLESLREKGQKTPIVVRELLDAHGGGPRYELQGGHRRVAALRRLGRDRVTALITREVGVEADLRALIDNLGRPLSLLQLGRCLLLIQERHGLTLSKVAALSGIPRQRLSEVETVMDLQQALQNRVEEGALSVRAAAALRALPAAQQQDLAERIGAGDLTYERARDVAARIQAGTPVAEALAQCAVRTQMIAADSGRSASSIQSGESDAGEAAVERQAAPWARAWLSAHVSELGAEARDALAAEAETAALRPRALRLAALLALAGTDVRDSVAQALVLAATECGRTVAGVDELLARLEALDGVGRFSAACAPLLELLRQRLDRVEQRRAPFGCRGKVIRAN